MWKNTPAVAD